MREHTVNDEAALIRAAQGGDADAFEALLEHYYDTLYRFAWRWCGNEADAQDVTQQACLRIADHLGQFRFEAAFTSWLYRLVVNCARDWSRRQRRHAPASAVEARELAGEDGSVADRVYHWQLLETLDALPDGMKETLLLVHVEGLSHAEAAQALGVKESTVSWRLHDFRRRHGGALTAGGAL